MHPPSSWAFPRSHSRRGSLSESWVAGLCFLQWLTCRQTQNHIPEPYSSKPPPSPQEPRSTQCGVPFPGVSRFHCSLTDFSMEFIVHDKKASHHRTNFYRKKRNNTKMYHSDFTKKTLTITENLIWDSLTWFQYRKYFHLHEMPCNNNKLQFCIH